MTEPLFRYGSVYSSDQEAIRAITSVHTEGKIDVDVTYRRGAFYPAEIEPGRKFDLAPQTQDCEQADARNIPLESRSVDSMMFDPPFLVDAGGTGKLRDEFGAYPSFSKLWGMYLEVIGEAYRVLRSDGVLVVKCQDCVNNHKNYWSHVNIYQYATQLGFRGKDLAIRVNNNAMSRPGWKGQEHLRKNHCFYWVFVKG